MYEQSKGYPSHWSVLWFVLELLILKAKYGWSDSSFSDLLTLLAWLLPKPNFVPIITYQAKKVISPLTMGVEKIHACLNHCILYRGKLFENLDKCPTCGASHYQRNDICNEDCASNGKKRKKGTKTKEHDHTKETDACLGLDESKRRITALVMWYLNPIDRLRRMFANPVLSRLMVWWFFEWTRDEEKLDHPADGSQWKHFDDMYPEFTKDPRNVRFALSTDGMN